MDIRTSFMAASENDAKAIADNPKQPERWPGFSCLNLDLEKLADLLSLIHKRPVDEALLASFSVLHQSTVDGPWVIGLPSDFLASLANWTEAEAALYANQWASLPCFNDVSWRTEDLKAAIVHLGKVATLAAKKGQTVVLYQTVEGEKVSFS